MITIFFLFFALPVKAQTTYDKKQDARLTNLESKTLTLSASVVTQKLTNDSLRNRIINLESIKFYRPIVWLKGLEFINDTLRIKP